jgi:uncharacterized protein
MARTLRFTPGVAVPVVVAILGCVNVLDVKVPHAALVAGPVCAAGLIGLARLAGLGWHDLGLSAGTWARGARRALAPAGLHWATNALGVLAATAIWAWGT